MGATLAGRSRGSGEGEGGGMKLERAGGEKKKMGREWGANVKKGYGGNGWILKIVRGLRH